MTRNDSSPLGQEKLKKAIQAFSEKVLEKPDMSRQEIMSEIQLSFDLSPLECEFLNKHFSKNQ